jgi:DNA polymerase elongation subunit (family B)
VRKSHLTVVPSGRPNPFKNLINAFSTREDPNQITLVVRDDEGRLVTRPIKAEHVCFVRDSEMTERAERALRESKHVEGIRKVGQHWRINWKDRWTLAKAVRPEQWFSRQNIAPLEADVDPIRRYITDHEITIARPRRCFIDLEADSRMTRVNKDLARMLSWAVVDEQGDLVASDVLKEETDASERELIQGLWRCLEKFDQVCAWAGDFFDFPYLLARTKYHRIKVQPERFLWLDHLTLFRKMNASASKSGDEKQSMKLDSVAKSLKLQGKTEGVDGSKTYELWKSDPQKLLEYNENDTQLCQQIEQKTHYIDQLYALCALTYCFPDSRGMKPTRQVEGFLMKLGSKQGMRFPTRPWSEKEDDGEKKYGGAYVMEPVVGVYENVHVCDFSGMYPNDIRTFNLSIETVRGRLPDPNLGRPLYLAHLPEEPDKIPEGCAVVPLTRVIVQQEPRGILPQALDECMRLRSYWSKKKASLPPNTPEADEAERMDSAYKIFVNSFYGVMGNVYSRFFMVDVAESTSLSGVWLIKETIKAVEARGWKAIYGDTDSVFVVGPTDEEFKEFVAWCNAELYPRLVAERGCTRNTVSLAYEKKFERIVIAAKKRYAAMIEHFKGTKAKPDSALEVKGLEYRRGDTSRIARRMQLELVEMICRQGIVDPTAFEELVEKYKVHVLDSDLSLDDVVISKRLTQAPDEYKTRTSHVDVAKMLQARGETLYKGDKIDFVVTDGYRSPVQVIPSADYDPKSETKNADRFYLWEKLVYPPTSRVLQAAFPKGNWEKYERVRPQRLKGVLPGQLGFGIGEAPAPPLRAKPTTSLVEVVSKKVVAKLVEEALDDLGYGDDDDDSDYYDD